MKIKIGKYEFEISKQILIQYAIILGMIIFSIICIQTCCSYRTKYKRSINNIEVIKDTITQYVADNGQIVTEKKLLEGELSDMKTLNDSLYQKIKDLGFKNKEVETVVEYVSVASLPEVDTVWEIGPESIEYITKDSIIYVDNEPVVIHPTIQKDFAFNDEYRDLEGNISLSQDSLGMEVTKEQVKLDYDIIVDKDNAVHITSSNPYVKINEISGFTIPKTKVKRWGIGPQVGYGYDFQHNKFAPFIGIGLQYNLIRF